MKHKTGKDINVLGEITIDSTQYFLCKLSSFYHNDILISFIAIPVHDFIRTLDGFVEVIENEQIVDPRNVSETNRTKTGTIQTEGNS